MCGGAVINRRASLTNVLGPLVRMTSGATVVGAHHIPATGAALIVSLEPVDITTVRSHLTRPLTALLSSQSEPRDVALARLWSDVVSSGNYGIDVHRAAREALEQGGLVLTDTKTAEVGYLALAAGAPVIPIAFVPTPRDARIFIGPANSESDHEQPLTPERIRAFSEKIRQSVADHDLAARKRASGMMAP